MSAMICKIGASDMLEVTECPFLALNALTYAMTDTATELTRKGEVRENLGMDPAIDGDSLSGNAPPIRPPSLYDLGL